MLNLINAPQVWVILISLNILLLLMCSLHGWSMNLDLIAFQDSYGL